VIDNKNMWSKRQEFGRKKRDGESQVPQQVDPRFRSSRSKKKRAHLSGRGGGKKIKWNDTGGRRIPDNHFYDSSWRGKNDVTLGGGAAISGTKRDTRDY